MRKNKCKNCKDTIQEGYFCSEECKDTYYNKIIEKQKNKRLAKMKEQDWYHINRVKEEADMRYWASAHDGCFRCSIGPGEKDPHIRGKFERWLYHRRRGCIVFTELRLKDGMGRPDLLIIDNGEIFIEEIVNTEKEKSLLLKKDKYPFPMTIIKVENE